MSARVTGWAAAVFLFVLVTQLVLIARIGTDIPYQDQWSAEGAQLYPRWVEGTLTPADVVAPHNEHRIAATRVFDLALFAANGHWDPLVQLAANAGLRAAVAALLAGFLVAMTGVRAMGWAGLVAIAFLPHLAWQNVLWGFQSQVSFVLGFSLATFALLLPDDASPGRKCLGLAAGLLALLSMGAAVLVPWVLLAWTVVRMMERRGAPGALLRDSWPALVLAIAGWALRTEPAAHVGLHPHSLLSFFEALGRAAAWPHVGFPLAALAMNLPLLAMVFLRVSRRRRPAAVDDFVVVVGGWALGLAVAMAWTRGGGGEFDGGVPSRYADFLVLLPIANVVCLARLVADVAGPRRTAIRMAGAAWALFLVAGWVGLSTEVMSRLVLPRWRDPEAPVRLAQEFRRTRDPGVFAQAPRLYVPADNFGAITSVLDDPRLAGRLPPSLQPGHPLGPLSRATRTLLRR